MQPCVAEFCHKHAIRRRSAKSDCISDKREGLWDLFYRRIFFLVNLTKPNFFVLYKMISLFKLYFHLFSITSYDNVLFSDLDFCLSTWIFIHRGQTIKLRAQPSDIEWRWKVGWSVGCKVNESFATKAITVRCNWKVKNDSRCGHIWITRWEWCVGNRISRRHLGPAYYDSRVSFYSYIIRGDKYQYIDNRPRSLDRSVDPCRTCAR